MRFIKQKMELSQARMLLFAKAEVRGELAPSSNVSFSNEIPALASSKYGIGTGQSLRDGG